MNIQNVVFKSLVLVDKTTSTPMVVFFNTDERYRKQLDLTYNNHKVTFEHSTSDIKASFDKGMNIFSGLPFVYN